MTQSLALATGCSAGATESLIVVPTELIKVKCTLLHLKYTLITLNYRLDYKIRIQNSLDLWMLLRKLLELKV